MQKRPRLLIHNLWTQNLVLRVTAVIQHHRRPILPRVNSLNSPVHLSSLLWCVIMLHTHHSVLIIG
ncbi:hypothetical protein HanXRQr2_Chr09g0415181 [Helianthus annuus]|uniref:Uncharacterized protein n=1 Tax=Helianthus annuus TaxID=4232 RepID=A0A9K3NAE0_HELAN|nr:hypothetical protein HanXRQr2_Chr09g0415181 [Helianthus annuus]KAJ0895503.1 hypothetical protein HanPSC8_Chr09g0401321 [Helianthus annuus]